MKSGNPIACAHSERRANISGIADSATQLYVRPQTPHFAEGCKPEACRDNSPVISLNMKLSYQRTVVCFASP